MRKMDKDYEEIFQINKEKIEVFREYADRTRFISTQVDQFTQTTSFYAENVF